MRSRYSAFVLGLADYLWRTWHPRTRPQRVHLDDTVWTGLEIVDVESLRLHYARTLDHWSERLEDNLEAAAKEVPDQALRIWRLYLAGCAYAFARGWINLHQILAVKPHADGSHDLPWTREDIYR